MEHIRKSIVQAQVWCTEHDPLLPSRVIDENEYSGTCFRVDPKLFPFGDKVLFLTNFHVCDNADNRLVHLRTAGMGKSALTGFVEAVVPQLDCAVISLQNKHEKWFMEDNPLDWVEKIAVAPLRKTRINTKTQKVSTIGFPQGLEEVLSSGWLAGRGSDDMDMLQLNISINSGNSGGPLCDKSGKVIGICTSTLVETEAIAFAVPIYSVLAYFAKFYDTPFGVFPQWGIQLMPMTDAFAVEFGIQRPGAVIRKIETGSSSAGKLKTGDVVHGIRSGDVDVQLDLFGLIHDETRGSKISINNTEFLMRLTPGDVSLDVTRGKRSLTIQVTPGIIEYKINENFKEWNPVETHTFGPVTIQNLSKSILTGELTAESVVELVEIMKRTNCMEEIIIVTHVKPRSYVSNMDVSLEFKVIEKIGRYKVKNMQHCITLLDSVRKRWERGEQERVCLGTTGGDIWLTLDHIYRGCKRKRQI